MARTPGAEIDEDKIDRIHELTGTLVELRQSQAWELITAAILKRKRDLQTSTSKPGQTKTQDDLRLLQGEIMGLDWALGAPDREIERLSAATTTAGR